MRDFRKLTTITLVNKALKKTGKQLPPLGQAAASTLYIIHLFQPITATKVLSRLKYYHMGKTSIANDKVLNKLIEAGYITSDHSPKQYSLTPLGLSYLRTLETNLRKARIDK